MREYESEKPVVNHKCVAICIELKVTLRIYLLV